MNRPIKIALPALTLLGCLSCDRPQPEPLEIARPEAPPTVQEAEANGEPEEEEPVFVEHEIADGQTLWEIARAYDLHVSDIMEANQLRPRDVRRLRAGQTLRIPGATEVVDVADASEPEQLPPVEGGAYHRLAAGETLWDVARLYEVALSDLVDRNEFDDERVRSLREGQAVIVPGVSDRQVAAAAQRRDRERERQRRSRPRGFSHRVARGETIWDLAGAFGVTVGEIMAANGLDEAGVRGLRDGTRLYIPGVERDAGGRVRRRLTGRQRRALRRANGLGLGSRRVASALLRGRVETRWIRAASRGRNTSRTPGTLRWPVTNGWFVRGFGSGAGGYHQAVDIMGRIGWNVRAAAPGIVAYAGNEVPGYGNMVMLIHPGGWVTMYAHNSANSVVAGEYVPRGGILGEVGSTGISRGPHVHFEFYYDGRNCDPAPLFRPAVRHRSGRRSSIHQLTWTRGNRRPEAIRCQRRRRHPQSRWVVRESFDENHQGEQ